MVEKLLADLYEAVSARSPSMRRLLRPGLREEEIRARLVDAGVEAPQEALIQLYSWRNGAQREAGLSNYDWCIFPKGIHHFLSLEEAVEEFKSNREAAAELVGITGDPTKLNEGASRYFPIFWDGSTGCLCVDLEPSKHGRVVMMEFESTEPFVEAYPSFEAFLEDAIRANREDDNLACFQP
jgi:SMI1 / KNR4 family (SUKH-1)